MNRREYLKNSTLLLGYAISATALSDIFISCNNNAEAGLSWEPVFLSHGQATTIAEIAETILPKTKTPGAKEIGVPQFIDKILNDILTEKDKQEFTEGIKTFEESCKKKFGKSFAACTRQEKEDFLLTLDKELADFPASVWGSPLELNPKPIPFFRKIKELTLFGYFNSKIVGKEYLAYDPVPGPFIGCMPLDGKNIWSGD